MKKELSNKDVAQTLLKEIDRLAVDCKDVERAEVIKLLAEARDVLRNS